VDVLLNLQSVGELPERITHNDTKINNVMMDLKTGEGLCVMDLDTVMPGLVLYDFGDLVRATTIQVGHAKLHTVEHVLSALHGCGIDNVIIDIDASEPPIMDGSARPFVQLIQQGEPVEQDAEREYFVLTDTVSGTVRVVRRPARPPRSRAYLCRRRWQPRLAPTTTPGCCRGSRMLHVAPC
jgi:UDP-3-O-acyl-N-acetylglucosamine deacetylase